MVSTHARVLAIVVVGVGLFSSGERPVHLVPPLSAAVAPAAPLNLFTIRSTRQDGTHCI